MKVIFRLAAMTLFILTNPARCAPSSLGEGAEELSMARVGESAQLRPPPSSTPHEFTGNFVQGCPSDSQLDPADHFGSTSTDATIGAGSVRQEAAFVWDNLDSPTRHEWVERAPSVSSPAPRSDIAVKGNVRPDPANKLILAERETVSPQIASSETEGKTYASQIRGSPPAELTPAPPAMKSLSSEPPEPRRPAPTRPPPPLPASRSSAPVLEQQNQPIDQAIESGSIQKLGRDGGLPNAPQSTNPTSAEPVLEKNNAARQHTQETVKGLASKSLQSESSPGRSSSLTDSNASRATEADKPNGSKSEYWKAREQIACMVDKPLRETPARQLSTTGKAKEASAEMAEETKQKTSPGSTPKNLAKKSALPKVREIPLEMGPFELIQGAFERLIDDSESLEANSPDQEFWKIFNEYNKNIDIVHSGIDEYVMPLLGQKSTSKSKGPRKALRKSQIPELTNIFTEHLKYLIHRRKLDIILPSIRTKYQNLELQQMKGILCTISFLREASILKTKNVKTIFGTPEALESFGWYISHFQSYSDPSPDGKTLHNYKSSGVHFKTTFEQWDFRNIYWLKPVIRQESWEKITWNFWNSKVQQYVTKRSDLNHQSEKKTLELLSQVFNKDNFDHLQDLVKAVEISSFKNIHDHIPTIHLTKESKQMVINIQYLLKNLMKSDIRIFPHFHELDPGPMIYGILEFFDSRFGKESLKKIWFTSSDKKSARAVDYLQSMGEIPEGSKLKIPEGLKPILAQDKQQFENFYLRVKFVGGAIKINDYIGLAISDLYQLHETQAVINSAELLEYYSNRIHQSSEIFIKKFRDQPQTTTLEQLSIKFQISTEFLDFLGKSHSKNKFYREELERIWNGLQIESSFKKSPNNDLPRKSSLKKHNY
ncbi:hypothetical protein PSHT_03253 [Puccinia striiformis]|uniref:Uncharacterized protein n=1 Tax=Puccinia striiformis TaxID=27350 RepID=A0A2S4WFX8_9BASI|nr:hypothetical protein PSHT_03253 [Puccinia striiformis]